MKKLREKWKKDSMMARMMLFVVLIVLFSTIVLTVSGNVIYSNSIRSYAYSSTAEIQAQVQESMDSKIAAIDHSLATIGMMDSVQRYLKTDEIKEPKERLDTESNVRELLIGYSAIYKEYLNIVVVSAKGQYLSNDSYRIQKTELSGEDWYKAAVAADGKPVVMSSFIGRNLASWKNYSANSYISVAKTIKDNYTGEVLGVIMVDWSIEGIQALVQGITLGETGFVFIMDVNGNMMYSPENKIVYRIRPSWFTKKKNGSSRCSILGGDYTLIYNQSSVTGLLTVGVYDNRKTIEGVADIEFMSFILACITLLFGALWALAFSSSFTKPIKKLSRLMKKAQTGDFSVRFEDKANGEIKQLGDSFNSMIDRTNELINLVYIEQKNKREAEMKMLQEQIKPHFLYNTLDTIQWMARKYQADDIRDMVLSLSHFFRISLSRGKEYITLAEEFTMVRSYLDIQKYRYEDMFEYNAEYDTEIADCDVIKLMLQPIVENALYHGIKESDAEHGTIWINAVKESSNTILITVEDDGAGVTEDICNYLNNIINTKDRPDDVKSFGVINVSDRIKMSYGDSFGLTFMQRQGGGTRVEIRTKYAAKGEQDVENSDS